MCGLGKKRSSKINNLKDRRESAFKSKKFLSQNIGISW